MRLTLEEAEALIESEEYHWFENTTIVVCCLKLKRNCRVKIGVTGESVCTNHIHFTEEKGKQEAYKKAIEKLLDLEEYFSEKLEVAYNRNSEWKAPTAEFKFPSWFTIDKTFLLGNYDAEKDVVSSYSKVMQGLSIKQVAKLLLNPGFYLTVSRGNGKEYSVGDIIATDGVMWHHWSKETFKDN